MNIKKIAIAAGMISAMMPKSKPQRILRFVNPNEEAKYSRNSPCHCGSGKKYKKCCLDSPTELKED